MSRRGSAIVGAIWILAVLSILIATYAFDAQLQTRVNIYLQEKVHVDHLTDAGIVIAEVILTDYQNVTDPLTLTASQIEEKLEDDRWYMEKAELKKGNLCTTGAVPVDALDPDGGTVTVTIRPIESKWNINNLYRGGDANSDVIWESILAMSGIPEDYWDNIRLSWYDWRDTDSAILQEEDGEGGETEFYREAYEDCLDGKDEEKNKNYLPKARDGEIADLDELRHLRGFNEYEDEPINCDAILDGGILNPSAKKEDQIVVEKGIRRFFSVFGSGKLNVNTTDDPEILATVPGIYQGANSSSFDEDDVTNALVTAKILVEMIKGDGTMKSKDSSTVGDDYTGPVKSFSELREHYTEYMQQDATMDKKYIQDEADQYLSYDPDKFFEVSITGASMGITHTVKAVAIVDSKNGNKVRYIRWQEDP